MSITNPDSASFKQSPTAPSADVSVGDKEKEEGFVEKEPPSAFTCETQNFRTLRSANVARQAEWCPEQVPDLSFRGNELAGETGEVCNVIKKLERERHGWRGSRDTVEHLAEELADVVICADLISIAAGINLEAAVASKFNATSEKVGLPQRLQPDGSGSNASSLPDPNARSVALATKSEGGSEFPQTELSEKLVRDVTYELQNVLGCGVVDPRKVYPVLRAAFAKLIRRPSSSDQAEPRKEGDAKCAPASQLHMPEKRPSSAAPVVQPDSVAASSDQAIQREEDSSGKRGAI